MKNTKNSANRRVLGQLLHGSWRYFIACIAASLLFTAFELVIPQIIRVSVDSLIGSGPVKVAAARPVVQALGGSDVFHCAYHAGALQSFAAVPIMSRATPIGCVYVMDFDAEQGEIIENLEGNILRGSWILLRASTPVFSP